MNASESGQSLRFAILSAAMIAALPLGARAQDFLDDSTSRVNGYFELFGGGSWYQLNERDESDVLRSTAKANGGTFGGAARGAFEIMPDWGGQVDGWIRRDNFSGEFCEPPGNCDPDHRFQQIWGIGAHVNHGGVGMPLFGALLSVGGKANTGAGETSFINVAGEAQYSIGPLTAYGQGGYVHSIGGDLADENARAWYVHAEVQYFKKQNLLFAANVGFGRYFLDDMALYAGRHANIFRWGAKVEYKFDHAPVSLFAAYEAGWVRASFDYSGTGYDDRLRDQRLTAGLHWWFQEGSLQLNLRTGARLTDWNPVFGLDQVVF